MSKGFVCKATLPGKSCKLTYMMGVRSVSLNLFCRSSFLFSVISVTECHIRPPGFLFVCFFISTDSIRKDRTSKIIFSQRSFLSSSSFLMIKGKKSFWIRTSYSGYILFKYVPGLMTRKPDIILIPFQCGPWWNCHQKIFQDRCTLQGPSCHFIGSEEEYEVIRDRTSTETKVIQPQTCAANMLPTGSTQLWSVCLWILHYPQGIPNRLNIL